MPMLLLNTILGIGDTKWTKVIKSLFWWIHADEGGGEQRKQIYKKIPDYEREKW